MPGLNFLLRSECGQSIASREEEGIKVKSYTPVKERETNPNALKAQAFGEKSKGSYCIKRNVKAKINSK